MAGAGSVAAGLPGWVPDWLPVVALVGGIVGPTLAALSIAITLLLRRRDTKQRLRIYGEPVQLPDGSGAASFTIRNTGRVAATVEDFHVVLGFPGQPDHLMPSEGFRANKELPFRLEPRETARFQVGMGMVRNRVKRGNLGTSRYLIPAVVDGLERVHEGKPFRFYMGERAHPFAEPEPLPKDPFGWNLRFPAWLLWRKVRRRFGRAPSAT